MSVWDSYPANYRAREVQYIHTAVQAGECVAVVGLSGAGKSNLIGFLANCSPLAAPRSPGFTAHRFPVLALVRRKRGADDRADAGDERRR